MLKKVYLPDICVNDKQKQDAKDNRKLMDETC